MTYLDRNSLYTGLWSFTSFEKLRVLFIRYLNNNWWLVNNQMKIKDWVLYIEWDPGFSKRLMWRLRRLSNRSTRQIGCIRVSRIFGGFDCWVSRFKSSTKNCWNMRLVEDISSLKEQYWCNIFKKNKNNSIDLGLWERINQLVRTVWLNIYRSSCSFSLSFNFLYIIHHIRKCIRERQLSKSDTN